MQHAFSPRLCGTQEQRRDSPCHATPVTVTFSPADLSLRHTGLEGHGELKHKGWGSVCRAGTGLFSTRHLLHRPPAELRHRAGSISPAMLTPIHCRQSQALIQLQGDALQILLETQSREGTARAGSTTRCLHFVLSMKDAVCTRDRP